MSEEAMVTRAGALDMQVCVPGAWTNAQVLAFVEREHPCGTQHGWQIRQNGDPKLNGASERVPCSGGPAGNVHIMLDA